MTKHAVSVFCGCVLLAIAAFARSPQPTVLLPLAASGSPASATKPYVVADLAERVAKFKLVHMPFNSQGLSPHEIKMVEKLVDASGLLDCIYWRQSDPEGLQLYLSLAKSKDPQDELLRRYLKINGSRFDLIDDDKPFVGTQPMPAGRGFYLLAAFPGSAARHELEKFVAEHPEKKPEIYSPYTIIKGMMPETANSNSHPEAIPYHIAFRDFLMPMAKDLREAADLSDDPAFAKFLRLRADALLTDDYYASDIAWLDLENPKFDVIFAPYESVSHRESSDHLAQPSAQSPIEFLKRVKKSRIPSRHKNKLPDPNRQVAVLLETRHAVADVGAPTLQHCFKLFEGRAAQLDRHHILVKPLRAISKHPLFNLDCRNEENNDPGQEENAAQ